MAGRFCLYILYYILLLKQKRRNPLVRIDMEGEEEAAGGGSKKLPLHKLLFMADAVDVVAMVAGTAGALANGASQPLMSVIFGALIDAFAGFGSSEPDITVRVNKVVVDFVYLAVGTAIAAFLQVSCWTITAERQAARIRALYLKSILQQDMAFFDENATTGQIISRMTADVVLIQDAIGEKVGKFIQLIATFIGGFLVAFLRGWLLSLVMLACIPPIGIAGGLFAWFMSKISSQGQAAYSEAANIVAQTVGSIRTVVAFNGEEQTAAMYNSSIKKTYRATVKEGIANGIAMGIVILVMLGSFGLAIWFGGKLVLTKGYSGGAIINILFAVITGAMALGSASPCLSSFAQGRVAAHRMLQTISRKPSIDSENNSGIILDGIKGEIELKNVYFSYPARPEQLILNGISLHVPSGSTMAIVGESGSGKSTIISLLERFYDPQAGEILIDGVNMKALRLDWIRSKIGLVSQEPLLFMASIKENILYGREGATMEEIREAAEFANAASFILKLPEGFETMVGERGAQLSGGQKQRIAIARAILKNPKILLLDEATSALDNDSERIVQEALTKVMVDRTTIIVAHRLSTVRCAQCISVIRQGKLVEQGSHGELIKDHGGAYSQLIRLQEANVAETSILRPGFQGSMSKRCASLERSVDRGSLGNSSRHSLGNSSRHSVNMGFVLPGFVELLNDEDNIYEPDEKIGDGSHKMDVPIWRLIQLNKPEMIVFVLASLAATVYGVIYPLCGVVIAGAITTYYEPPDLLHKNSRFWALICLVLGGSGLVFLPIEHFLFGIAGGKLVKRTRRLLFLSMVHQEIEWFDDPSNTSGAIGARLATDALNVRRLVGDSLSLLVESFSMAATGFTIAMVANWQLSLVVIAVIPLLSLQGYAQVKFLRGFSADAKKLYENATQVAAEAVASIRTVASFGAGPRVLKMYNKHCQLSMKQGSRTGLISGLGFGFSFLMLYLSYALCFFVGAQFVHQGKCTFFDVFKVFFALVVATIGISQTSAYGSNFSKAKHSALSVFAVIDRKSKIDSSDGSGIFLDKVTGHVEFSNVKFSYPSRPEVQIFGGFNLIIPPGKTVALVGESGCGKSTAIALLERFYDPDSGTIMLDSVEIQKLNVGWLRRQMGLVNQEPALFNWTIRANIAYGKLQGEATEEEVVAAAKAANAHDFISALPRGYDTNVGEYGAQLSGGQKQRVAIARAIMRDPRILLLDEATSALDAESESVVQAALDRLMVDRTTLIVAHRLSTIRGADMIAVLKDGAVAEKGRHEELMKINDGFYASLVDIRVLQE